MDIRGLPFILASASPRRKEILESHGLSPIIMPSGIDESIAEEAGFTPCELTVRLAEQKALAVMDKLIPEDWPSGCVILGVDTIVYKDRIIGKPADEADALGILRSLKNTEHEVISGVCLVKVAPQPGSKSLSVNEKHLFYDITRVRFGDYTDDEILGYITANPPYDKSGSYAVQSDWGRHVTEINGDIENVIGLPYTKLSSYFQPIKID